MPSESRRRFSHVVQKKHNKQCRAADKGWSSNVSILIESRFVPLYLVAVFPAFKISVTKVFAVYMQLYVFLKQMTSSSSLIAARLVSFASAYATEAEASLKRNGYAVRNRLVQV
jgi:hypothetical protein